MRHLAPVFFLMLTALPVWAEDMFLTAEHAVAEHGPRSVYTLVDFRPSKDFTRLSIPHSLNVPLAALEGMPHLKNRRLILVGTGHSLAEPCETARNLRGQGWRIHILLGGLPAWQDAGGSLTGDPFVLDEYREVSLNTLKADALQIPLALAVVDGLSHKASAVLNTTAVHVFEPRHGESRQEFLHRMDNASMPVCLADANGRFPHRLIRDARQAGLKNFLILRGGTAALSPIFPAPCSPCDERNN